jgi:hypothetical protein
MFFVLAYPRETQEMVFRRPFLPRSLHARHPLQHEDGSVMRERFFTPRLRFNTLEDLNGWLVDKCVLRQGTPASRTGRPHDLGGVRGDCRSALATVTSSN